MREFNYETQHKRQTYRILEVFNITGFEVSYKFQ